MTETARLLLAVDASQVGRARDALGRFVAQGRQAEAEAGRMTSAVSRFGRSASSDMSRVARATDGVSSAFRRLAGPLAAYLSTREIAAAAESWVLLTNRLRLVTDSTQELADAQAAVFEIAQNSRQPLEATGELYQRIATNADALGLSGAGVAAVVDTINKTLAISGTSGASAEAALIQLGQAFASGTLRGEELNSVLEQAPALARAIADGMGVTVGQLRQLGQDGVLTSEAVVNALLKQGDAIDQQFGRIQATMGQAFTTLSNSLTRAVGEIDTATGASSTFASALMGLSQWIDGGALVNGVIETFRLWQLTFDDASSGIDELGNEFELLEDVASGSLDLILLSLKQLPINVKAALEILTVEAASLFDKALIQAQGFWDQIQNIFGDNWPAETIERRTQAAMEAAEQARRESIDSIYAERDAIIKTAEAERARREEEARSAAARRASRESEIAGLRASAGSAPVSLGAPSGSGSGSGKSAGRKATDARLAYVREMMKEADSIWREIEDQMRERAALLERVQSIKLGAMDEEQRSLIELRDKYLELNKAVQQGVITEQEAATIRGQLQQQWSERQDEVIKATDEMSEFAKAAAQNMQSAFADFLFDPFDGGLKGMLLGFVNTLRRMAAEALASQIFGAVFKSAAGSGGLLGTIAGAFTGAHDSGGTIPAGKWGIAGERGPEIITGPAHVTSRKDTAAALAGPQNIRVVMVQNDDELAGMLSSSPAMERVIVHHIGRNKRKLGLG